VQEAYDSRKLRASGADGHAVQYCLPSYITDTSQCIAVQYIVRCRLWHHCTVTIIQKKRFYFYTYDNRFSIKTITSLLLSALLIVCLQCPCSNFDRDSVTVISAFIIDNNNNDIINNYTRIVR